MPVLPLLADPAAYRPCIQDLLVDSQARAYWLELFERHVDTLAALPVGNRRLDGSAAWDAFHSDYLAGLSALRREPALRGSLSVLELTRYRDEKLGQHGYDDPFLDLKRRENAVAVRQFRDVIATVDATPADRRMHLLATGLFAGNLFDMGSKAAIEAFERGGGDFQAAVQRVKQRPWAVDDLDRWIASARVYRQCLFFVDNAGPDIVLGVIPFVRELCRRGTRVVLAANSCPSLNDMTATELSDLLDKLGKLDPTLAAMTSGGREARIRVTPSGCASPLIDLRQLTDACCEAAAESDLLVLEGMGRAIESNYDADFTVDTLKIALIKDPMVARTLHVPMFEPVFRFEQMGAR